MAAADQALTLAAAAQVQCMAVAKERATMLEFVKWVTSYAPIVEKRDQIQNDDRVSVFDDEVFNLEGLDAGPTRNQSALDCFNKGVFQVAPLSAEVRSMYGNPPSSRMSEDPDDTVSTASFRSDSNDPMR
ncbi:hypothetical protein GPECTOR_56g395 [Gonium pectorale]|uniref:Uncharacterized protein n=1 Tax=Gonium pectorale TaxID=33097 RepID=A0A150G5Z0_GONPE|nr:hypothetical protein GPECTOR_56g395 [Gonium pectorale]|eukprot:KXZ45299.1 hypothetical protein GPECTOR_56g395 [Gonium pectorale]